jgi:hypothetical protein
MSLLRRYWFRFRGPSETLPAGVAYGCGVTAHDYVDAVELLEAQIFEGADFPEIEEVVEEVDVSDLDAGHVLPNMDDPGRRGVWFPRR